METCITPLPDVQDSKAVAGGGPLAKWPARLTATPPRILTGSIPGVTEETYREDTQHWADRVAHYKNFIARLKDGKYRNIMDMNAGFGGFAAALAFDPVWVMNAVPPDSALDTLGVIYERGLIGSYQDWYAVPPFTSSPCDVGDFMIECYYTYGGLSCTSHPLYVPRAEVTSVTSKRNVSGGFFGYCSAFYGGGTVVRSYLLFLVTKATVMSLSTVLLICF